jgi:tetratricopeptide (TPR) repeat protein
MSIYPGNPSLSPAVRDRVQATFQQSIALLQQGRTDEVIAGCTLILQMDPLFDPAKKLLEKARNPSMPLDINSLVPGGSGSDPRLDQAREALLTRDFERAVHLASEVLSSDPMNSDAQAIGELAQEKMEAAPFVMQFIRKAEESLAAGNTALATTQLEKARSLDADHPSIATLEQSIAGGGASQFNFEAPVETPSFVVDAPATPGRGTAQASDFGFTFEEQAAEPAPAVDSFASFSFGETAAPAPAPEPPPPAPAATGFSFDAPSTDSPFAGGFSFDAAPAAAAPSAPAAPASTSNEFDFSNVGAASADDQKKIEQYLAEGDRAFDAGEYQKSIDLWSRIFLIDVTNDAASDRIERAKMKRREIDQRVESMLGNAVHAYERRDYATARSGFEEILAIDPQNVSAQDYLDRIPADGSAPAAAFAPPPAPTPELDLLADEPLGGSYEPPMMPPDDDFDEPVAAPAAGAKKKSASPAKAAPAPAKKSRPMGMIAAVLGLVVLLAGGWFAWTKFAGGPKVDPAQTEAIFTRAANLAQAGKYDQAISALQEIPGDDPQRDRALGMIADFQGKKAKAAQMIDGVPAAQFYETSLAAATTAFEAHDYVAAKKAYEQAMRVKALPPDVKASYDIASQQTAKLDSAKALFAGRRYADAVANLEPLLAADPQNKSIQRMLIDAHFNLGATALREERLPDAVREFEQVLQMDPTDELAKRSKDLALRYEGEQKDLLYRTYVKYLPYRQAV